MATNIKWRRRFFHTNGDEFIAGNFAGADLRLQTCASNGVGTGVIGSFTAEGNGIWWINIDVDTYGSNYYLVEWLTDATDPAPGWQAVGTLDPVFIELTDTMPLTGGTMSGAIATTINSVTNVNSITFNDTAGTVAGIANGNLIDKTADETITGAWTFSGDCALTGSNTVTGITSFTTDKCLSNSVIVQPYHHITHTWDGAITGSDLDAVLFTCDTAITLIAVYECHGGTSTAGASIKVERLSDTEVAGGGDDVTDAFSLQAAADTDHKDVALVNANFAAGDRVGVYRFIGTGAGADNVHLTIIFRYGA